MVLTVSFVLSPVTGLFCHRRPADMFLSKPGRADATSANLTPASGRQDHTTSPYAATSLVRSLGDRSQAFRQPALRSHRAQNAAASTASAPRVRDDRDTPLWWGGMARILELMVNGNRNISENPKIRLDSPVNNPPDGQITTRRREHVPLVSRSQFAFVCAAEPGREPTHPEWSGTSALVRIPDSSRTLRHFRKVPTKRHRALHSITSSARPSSSAGISRPSAFEG